jgi:hypothetical protein
MRNTQRHKNKDQSALSKNNHPMMEQTKKKKENHIVRGIKEKRERMKCDNTVASR